MHQPLAHWPMHTRVHALAAQMDEVMDLLALDLLDAARKDGGEGLARARDTCLGCGASRLCRAWVAASIAMEEPPVFCPNAAFFGSCRKRQDRPQPEGPPASSVRRNAAASSAPE